jgi:type I restriction-modification system DNA methylase subunit
MTEFLANPVIRLVSARKGRRQLRRKEWLFLAGLRPSHSLNSKPTTTQPTTAQSLRALLKSARDIMRKDKGLNGHVDRLPMLTWIMFLKFLDDLELQREQEAKLAGKKFKPAIEPPYRWRDWSARSDGNTGDELLAFLNNDETALPSSTADANDVIAHVGVISPA